jgi:ankyrin repeat protein
MLACCQFHRSGFEQHFAESRSVQFVDEMQLRERDIDMRGLAGRTTSSPPNPLFVYPVWGVKEALWISAPIPSHIWIVENHWGHRNVVEEISRCWPNILSLMNFFDAAPLTVRKAILGNDSALVTVFDNFYDPDSIQVVEKLLDRHASVIPSPDAPISALHYAARLKVPVLVQRILGSRAPLEATTRDGETPLHSACGWSSEEDTEVVSILLMAGANIQACDHSGRMPIHHAAQHGFPRTIKLLLGRCPNVKAVTENGSTPLHLATDKKQNDSIEPLLEAGADINAKDSGGNTPLHYAAEWSDKWDTKWVQRLLDLQADVNAGNNNDETPLHLALKGSRWRRQSSLLLPNPDGLMDGISKILQILLSQSPNVNTKSKVGLTPLHEAASWVNPTVMGALLQNGADVNARNSEGMTPLHIAVTDGAYGANIGLLLDNGADVNAVTDDGWTPLHCHLRKEKT